MTNSLDSPYRSEYLSILRDTIHDKIAYHYLNRNQYQLYFDPEAANDINYQAGKRLSILLRCHPEDIAEVKRLAEAAFKMPRLRELLRYHGYSLIRQSDAMILYGITMDQIISYHRMTEKPRMRHYQTKMETFIKLTMVDELTKKSVSITHKNGNAFTAEQEAYRLLYGDMG